MRIRKFARQVIVLLFAICLIQSALLPASAQSGRKRQPPPAGPKYETQDKNDSSEKSNKPLADNTPVTVDENGTMKMDTTLVTIPASVTDRDGRFVPFLTKRDFQIFEDGVQQEIEHLESVSSPFHLVLLLDTSASTLFRHEDIQQAAAEFAEQLRRDDKVMVASFDEDIEVWCDFTNSREEIRRAIYRTRRGGNTKLYDAVDVMVKDALDKVQGRKAIIVFSDGVDTTSRYSTYNRSLAMIEESGALGYSIYYNTEADNPSGPVINGRNPGGQPPIMTPPWPGRRRWPWNPFITFQRPGQWPGRVPRGGSRDDYARGQKYMQELADRSGGRSYTADSLSNLSYAFKQIAEELRHQYAIGYYPTNPKRDGSFRQIKVRVNETGLIVRARDGYRAGSDTQADTGDANERKRPVLKRRQLAAN